MGTGFVNQALVIEEEHFSDRAVDGEDM